MWRSDVADHPIDPRAPVDPAVRTPGREGLTGTAPANVFGGLPRDEDVTVAPDFRPAADQPAWRQDFPIDWPQDHYVERRDFMKFLALTSLAFAVGQIWIAAQGWMRAAFGVPAPRRVAAVSDVPVGGSLVFSFPGEHDPCVLVRLAERRFVAYGQKCTHLSCAVIPRPAEHTLHCPCHEGIFDLGSGRPIAGPPRRPLDLITLEFRGTDIYATSVTRRTV
jgi:nitrite reductase/ring-hydroxylating ferredoxin subunit